jgi:hypothetical protein
MYLSDGGQDGISDGGHGRGEGGEYLIVGPGCRLGLTNATDVGCGVRLCRDLGESPSSLSV